jgi:hypothetical protein
MRKYEFDNLFVSVIDYLIAGVCLFHGADSLPYKTHLIHI